MDRRIIELLKKLGLWRNFVVIMILRAPFDFLNAVLGANMLESFIRRSINIFLLISYIA